MTDQPNLRTMKIVVIDDDAANVALLEQVLGWGEFSQVIGYTDPVAALRDVLLDPPDVVLLDLHMPKIDGFDILEELRSHTLGEEHVPVLVFTADVNPEVRIKALRLGATDFITKPGDPAEIVLRVKNVLEIRYLHRALRKTNQELEKLVAARTAELTVARLDALERLALTAEFRDDDTGEHAKRVGRLSAEIASVLMSPEAPPETMELAAPLHDIGKVAISDSILLKPAKLSPEEFEVMKSHTTIGARILAGSDEDVFSVASAIALSHHEKWNGTGYPLGISGEDIPLPGRIVAVADVFDALAHKRVYKEAWPIHEAMKYIIDRAGTDFDPQVVCAFRQLYWEEAFPAAA